MNYGAFKPYDIANGPGCRVSLFVSGCRNKCPDCFNAEAWDFDYGERFSTKTWFDVLAKLTNPHISGLSILGGDPFESENVDTVTELCKAARKLEPKKSQWVWTGYLYEDLKDLEIMQYIDVLVDGPFVAALKDLSLTYRGSSNQRVIDIKKSHEAGEVVLWENGDGRLMRKRHTKEG